MVKKNLILIGGGGHCKSCIDVIESENKFKIAGIVDTKER
ncbi:MAG: acetyltransferase, partial [Candidatus Omnitrophica bacterium]|nr:acetyltransferase [Candidatus Omnitrophota bacterium]